MFRSNFLYAIILVILITGGIYAYVYFSATQALGTLEVTSIPPGATIYLDGTEKGLTPREIDQISLGFKEVTVKMEGYDSHSRRLHFHPSQRMALSFHLSRADYLLEEIHHLSGSLPRGFYDGGDFIYLFSTAGEMLSFEPATSQIKWQREFDTIVLSLPGSGAEQVSAATFFGTLYSLDEETGDLLGQVETGKGVQKLIDAEGLLYLLHTDGSLSAWEEGQRRWVFSGQELISHISLGESLVVLENQRIVFLHPVNGRVQKQIDLPVKNVKALGLFEGIFYLTKEGTLYGVELTRGDIEEIIEIGPGEITTLMGDGEGLFLGTEKGEVLLIQNGAVQWQVDLGEAISYLAIHQLLLVGTEDRSLYFLDRTAGEYLARKALPSPLTGLYPHEEGLYYVTFRSGTLARLTTPSW